MKLRLTISAAALALVAAACGSDDPTTVVEPAETETLAEATDAAAQGESPTSSDAASEVSQMTADGTADDSAPSTPALAGPGDVPDLDMVNVGSGETTNLQSVVTGQTPLLFWFYAPH